MLTAEEMIKNEIEKWNQLKQNNQLKPPETKEQIQNKKRVVDEHRMFVIHSLLLKYTPSIEDFQPKSKTDEYKQLEHFFVLISENKDANRILKRLWKKAGKVNPID